MSVLFLKHNFNFAPPKKKKKLNLSSELLPRVLIGCLMIEDPSSPHRLAQARSRCDRTPDAHSFSPSLEAPLTVTRSPGPRKKKKRRNFKQLIFPPLDSTVLLGRVTEVGQKLLKTHIPEVPGDELASLSQISLLTPEGRTTQLMMMVTRELRSNVLGNHQNSSPERVQPEHLVAAVNTVQMEVFENVWQ